MQQQEGSNSKDVKLQNRLLVLKLIATTGSISRVDISRVTGLSKMTIGNIVSELIKSDLLEEHITPSSEDTSISQGRPPIMLKISSQSPCICGMLIKRGLCQIIIADLSGHILEEITESYSKEITAEKLIATLLSNYHKLKKRVLRPLLAIGISSIGPIHSINGKILNPPSFYGIQNVPITSLIGDATGLPCYLINDANAGALAEKIYGLAKNESNFTYLHIMNGIGAGFVLENQLYNGNCGQSGEIGHTSINFSGPVCSCGNVGCLDLYANVENMRLQITKLAPFYPASPLTQLKIPKWADIVDSANQKDYLAITVLDEFCEYLSHAIVNVLNILDLSLLVVGYHSNTKGRIIEDLLSARLSTAVIYSKYRKIKIVHSSFSGDAPLIGSIALIADSIFNAALSL